ncbi:MAG: hypothetical protein ACOYXT_20330, partial [Bacteroidota bacterium]
MKQFIERLFEVLTYAGIAQGFFVTLLLNNKSVRRSRANLFLSILLLAISFSIMHMMYAGQVLSHFSVRVYHVGDPTFFLIAPMLWFYTQELTGRRVNWSFKLWLHFSPFLIIIFASLYLNRFPLDHPVINYLAHHQRLIFIFFWIFVIIQFSCYLYFVHRRWQTYQSMIEQEVSNTENVNISWVRFFMGIFLFINLFFLVTLFVLIHMSNMFQLYKSVPVIFSLSVFALGYRGILQKEIFSQSRLTEVVSKPSENNMAKNTDQQQLVNRLVQYMAERKPYLDAELTLSSLAKDLGLSRSLLSQVINEGVG